MTRRLVLTQPILLTPPGSFVRQIDGGPVGIVHTLDGDDAVTITWLTTALERAILPSTCVRPA